MTPQQEQPPRTDALREALELASAIPFQDHERVSDTRCSCGWRPNIGEPSTDYHGHLMLAVIASVGAAATPSPSSGPWKVLYDDYDAGTVFVTRDPTRSQSPLVEGLTIEQGTAIAAALNAATPSPEALREAAQRVYDLGIDDTNVPDDAWGKAWDALRAALAATPSPSSGLDVRKSYFGPYIHGLPGPAVILAVQGYQREPRRIVLPHQVYVETVEKLMAEPGVREVWALPYRDAEWIRVDEVAAEYARLQEQGR